MYIHVNGINIWYEKSGSGYPIVLLHGNSEKHEIFKVLVSQLSDKFTVYALDSRNHGKSGKSPELSYEIMTEDVAAFIRELKLEKPILYGFSDGGILGIMIAFKYPDLLSKMVISGANTSPDSVKPIGVKIFKIIYALTKDVKAKMLLTEPHITDEQLGRIEIPVLVLAGEKDLVKEEDTKHIAAMIKNSKLCIIPKEGHASYVVRSPKLYGYIKDFIADREPASVL
jgi:pimeloyl-ACP methyl ester carboxylesterase